MTLLEERIETAWRKSRDQAHFIPAYPINVPTDFIDGYITGVNEALASQWTNVKDGLPTLNADCIVVYTDRHGAYPCFSVASFCTGNQEWYSADDNLNRKGIKGWMYIPAPLLPKNVRGLKNPKRRANLLYKLRRHGITVDTKTRVIFIPYEENPFLHPQVKRLLDEYYFNIQFIIT